MDTAERTMLDKQLEQVTSISLEKAYNVREITTMWHLGKTPIYNDSFLTKKPVK